MKQIAYPIPGVTYHSDEVAARYFDQGAWANSTVGDALRQTAQRFPDRLAFIAEEQSISFSELDEKTECLGAALLNSGLIPGDRIVFQLGTTIETVIAVMACYKAGLVPVCAIPQYREVEISALISASNARAHFIQEGFSTSFDLADFAQKMAQTHPSIQYVLTFNQHEPENKMYALSALMAGIEFDEAKARLQQLVLSPRDVLSFQLSGGSTGIPKIIPRFHGEYLAHSAAWARCYEMDDETRIIWSLPIMHNAGQLYALIPPIFLGMTAVLMSRVDIPQMLDLIEKYQVTHSLSIGPIAPQLIAYQDLDRHDLSSLRLFATMSRADRLEEHLGVPCSNLYGITEGLLLGTGHSTNEWARHHTQGKSGCQFDEIQVLQLDNELSVETGQMGELCFKGPSSLLAYYNNELATKQSLTASGFVRTGDMVTAHERDGQLYYTFEGRLRDNINRGGEKISCEEVEGFISQHPDIADAKLVAMPDELYGEKGCVYLILRPGVGGIDEAELISFLVSQGLAKFKCPERIEIVKEFPITRVGKVDKVALRQDIENKLRDEQLLTQAEQHG